MIFSPYVKWIEQLNIFLFPVSFPEPEDQNNPLNYGSQSYRPPYTVDSHTPGYGK